MIEIFLMSKKTFRYNLILKKTLMNFYKWSNMNILKVKQEYKKSINYLKKLSNLSGRKNLKNLKSNKNKGTKLQREKSKYVDKYNYKIENIKNKNQQSFKIISKVLINLSDHTSHVISHISDYISILDNLKNLMLSQKTEDFLSGENTNKNVKIIEKNMNSNKFFLDAACYAFSLTALIHPIGLASVPICMYLNKQNYNSQKENLKISKDELISLKDSIEQSILFLKDQLFQIKLIKSTLENNLNVYVDMFKNIDNVVTQYEILLSNNNYDILLNLHNSKLKYITNQLISIEYQFNNINYLSFEIFTSSNHLKNKSNLK